MDVRLIILVSLISGVLGQDRIGFIEFYGYPGIADPAQLRVTLPVHEGDAYSAESRERLRKSIQQTTGREPTDIAAICCDERGDLVLFIGLPGSSTETFTYEAEPKGTIHLSKDVVDLYHRLENALEAAVKKGGTAVQEDDSKGYALVKDPAARSLQLAMHDYALKHESELLRVLRGSSDAEQRQIAAAAVGYVRPSPRQMEALIRASRDPDDTVRNNATRAVGVLLTSNPGLAQQIPAENFIRMMISGVWTDRNKAGSVLLGLTRTRDPKVLDRLHALAVDSLIEMAQWRDTGHAYNARVLLGRIAGIPEERLHKLAFQGPLQEIMDALASHRK